MARFKRMRDQQGATTAEYAVCTGAGVGFAGLLYQVLSSDVGQGIITKILQGIERLLPF